MQRSFQCGLSAYSIANSSCVLYLTAVCLFLLKFYLYTYLHTCDSSSVFQYYYVHVKTCDAPKWTGRTIKLSQVMDLILSQFLTHLRAEDYQNLSKTIAKKIQLLVAPDVTVWDQNDESGTFSTRSKTYIVKTIII